MLNLFDLIDNMSENDSITIHESDSTFIGSKRHLIDEQWVLDIENKVENFFFYIGTDYNYLKLYIQGHNKSIQMLERGL